MRFSFNASMRQMLTVVALVAALGAALVAASVWAAPGPAAADSAEIKPDRPDCIAPHATDNPACDPAKDPAQKQPKIELLEFDVAEDGTRFIFDPDQTYEDGMPKHGSGFVTQGYIYPKGTLNGTNGVNPDGTPEFPELVIGEWTCFGYMIGEGAHATTGAWVMSTQVYNLGEGYGEQTIVTSGYELADFNVPVTRAITGGTGDYAAATGEQRQELLGFTHNMGVNLRVALEVQTK